MNDVVLAKVGLWLLGLLPAGIGAALLVFYRNKKEKVTRAEGLIIFLFGVSIGHFLGHATVDILNINHESFAASSIVITWAIIGFGIFSEIYDRMPGAVKAVSDQVPDTLKALRKKFLGE